MSDPFVRTPGEANPVSALIPELLPGPLSTAADVHLAHSRIAASISAGQTPESVTSAALLTPEQLTTPAAPAHIAGMHRAFLSGLPVSLAADSSAPDWAHGMASATIAPRMETPDGLPAQLLSIVPLFQTHLTRAGDPQVLLSLPLPLLNFPGRSFTMGAGSVWFAAGKVAGAGVSGFAGLKVKSATLTADDDVTFAGSEAALPAGATATLVLELDATGAGANLRFPRSLTIVVAPGGISLSTVDPASFTAYGVSLGLTSAGGPVRYDAIHRDLTLPFTPDRPQFAPVNSGDAAFAPEGTADITEAVWAIPVAAVSAENLGAAAGPGALRTFLGPGLNLPVAAWKLSAALRQADLTVSVRSISFAGELAERTKVTMNLWDERVPAGASARLSSVSVQAKRGDRLRTTSDANGEAVFLQGACAPSLDRPVAGSGGRLRFGLDAALLAIVRSSAGTLGYVVAGKPDTSGESRFPIVLENAVLVAQRPQSMVIVGPIADGRIRSGALRLSLPLLDTVATLPDPYAANTSLPQRGDVPIGVLTAAVTWSPESAALLDISTRSNAANNGPGRERALALLLDVSTNADLFGVGLIESNGMQIDASALRASGSALALFTTPGVSWEPVEFDDPTITIDPPPNDGERTVVRVPTVQLTPVAPRPVLQAFVDAADAGAEAGMHFMLPFGLVADASLPARAVPDSGATFELVTPAFAGGLEGGLQLKLLPPNPQLPTAGFPGTVTTAGPGASQVLGSSVFSIFDGQFGVGPDSIVPVRRVDLSGYGNSMFSDWLDTATDAGVPAVAEARFDVVVGRTAYEVVQVVSVILPWAIRAVRTVTMARQAGGRIRRFDSGWVALSDGNFDLPPGVVAHRGPVSRVRNVHNITEQGAPLPLEPSPPGLDFQPVTFDADVVISADLALPDGGTKTGSVTVVPSKGLTGYLQLKPVKKFLTLAQLGELMQGRTAGGPLACTVDLGGSGVQGPHMRVTGIQVTATTGPGAPDLVVALLGPLRLPSNGSWSLGRLEPGQPAPAALDPNGSVPLIRANSDPTWHFADPQDINRLSAPKGIQYGLLQGTGTQRAFFAQPRVPQGTSQIGLGQPPHLADVAALLNSTGAFPDLKNAIHFDQPPVITSTGDRLTVEKHRFPLTGVPPRTILDLSPVQVLLAYADENGAPANVEVDINPGGSPSWTIDIGTVSLLLVLPPFGTATDPLLRLTGSIHADSLTAPTYKDLVVHFGGSMTLIQQIFTRLQELAKMLPGGSASLDVSFSDGKLTIRDSFTLPNLPLGFGQITEIGMNLGLTVAISPPSVDFQVGIASPEKPFHWLVSPLSGTGAVVVGSQDGRPTILIQGGIGVGLAINLGIASGGASVVLALQVDNRVAPLELKVILTGQAQVDVLDGLASAALTLSAALGMVPDQLPIPHQVTLFAEVAVGIHLSVCWVASIDFDGAWHFEQTLTSPIS